MSKMKLLWILVITMLATLMSSTICMADIIYQAKIGTDIDVILDPVYIEPLSRNAYTSRKESKIRINPDRLLSDMPSVTPLLPIGTNTEWVVISAFTPEKTAYQVGKALQEIRFTSLETDKSYSFPFLESQNVVKVYIDTVIAELKADVGSNIKVDLIENESNNISFTGYFMYWAKWDLYELGGQPILGLHIPCSLMGLYRSEDGVVAVALPLSVAWGGKYYYSDDFYLGGNLIGSIAYYASPDASESKNYIVNSWTYGVYFDINDYIYVGYVWKDNLDTGQKENIFVFGFGKELSKLLTQ
ncbi:MAG TPA: hypothetical protein VHY08_01830 [Bacillota bacterium]|nr:hypothetical protein [Bacillota bacterium]